MGSLTNENCLILFTRFPRRGKTKTRLAQELGDKNTVQLHKAFLRDIFSRFKERDFILVVAGATGDSREEFQRLAKITDLLIGFVYLKELQPMSR